MLTDFNTSDAKGKALEQTSNGLFFVVGSGRCGTTLLRAMFDSHSDMALPSETHFYGMFEERFRPGYESRDTATREATLKELFEEPRIQAMEIGMDQVRSLIEGHEGDWDVLFLALLTAFRDSRGVTRAGEKTPRHIHKFDYLSERFPKTKFIHLVRDPRAVVASFVSARFYQHPNGKNPYRAIEKWNGVMDAHFDIVKRADPSRYTLVRYEDLVNDAEGELHRLCAFLEVPFEPEMLDFRNRAKAGYLADETNREGIRKPVYKASVEKWREVLRPSDVKVIDALCGEHMKKLGYEPETAKPDLQTGVAAKWIHGAAVARDAARAAARTVGLKRKVVAVPIKES